MLETFLSVLKAERAEKMLAAERLDGDALRARFRDQIADLDAEIARVEARYR